MYEEIRKASKQSYLHTQVWLLTNTVIHIVAFVAFPSSKTVFPSWSCEPHIK